MIVWVLIRHHTDYFYEDTHTTYIVDGVYSTWDKAQEAAGSSIIAMGSKAGIIWKRDKDEFIGEVETCEKGHYYMLCKCKTLIKWTYEIIHCNLDDIASEDVPREAIVSGG